MWILVRYIGFEFIKRLLFFLVLLLFLFVGIDVLSKIWSIDASLWQLGLYYFFKTPQIAMQMIPVSILLATLMLLSYMSKHNELTALYTSGRSLFNITGSILVIVTTISIVGFYLSDYVLPATNFKAQKIWMVDILKRSGEFYDSLHQRKAWFRNKDTIYNVYSYDSKMNIATGISIYKFDHDFNMLENVYAKQAVYSGGKRWTLKDVKKTSFNAGKASTELVPALEVSFREEPDDFKKIEAKSDYLTASRLRKYILDLKNAGIPYAKYEVEFHKRYSMAFAGLIMCFIGIPFAVRQQRRGGVAINIGVGFTLVFAYWVLLSLMLSLGMSGKLWAPLSAWGANIAFVALSVFLVRKMRK